MIVDTSAILSIRLPRLPSYVAWKAPIVIPKALYNRKHGQRRHFDVVLMNVIIRHPVIEQCYKSNVMYTHYTASLSMTLNTQDGG